MAQIFERNQQIKDKRYAEWFGEVFEAHPYLQRIVVADKYTLPNAERLEFDSGGRLSHVPAPGQAVLVNGTAAVIIHDFDRMSLDKREGYRRTLIQCGTKLSPDYARTPQERELLGDERGHEQEIYG